MSSKTPAEKVRRDNRSAREIPWAEITGMRHRLIHDYRHVDVERVWYAVTKRLPELIALLGPLIPPEEDSA